MVFQREKGFYSHQKTAFIAGLAFFIFTRNSINIKFKNIR